VPGDFAGAPADFDDGDPGEPQPVTSITSTAATAMLLTVVVHRSLAGAWGRRTRMAVSSPRPLIMPGGPAGAQADSPFRASAIRGGWRAMS
jgi:hypothetical protein